ncbi:hypothetical protein R0131_14315 [Clostridium sp. AL.422]|uniref:hypothetical protein n=1 Tax=Clostridium TaxID=1485 RepID=UPI00293DDAB1|nr:MULTISPECIES: hypothetical protein [unclassified Clostridium]MDV4151999.1 hypothetical protein [Clostridium sp. AL.422]
MKRAKRAIIVGILTFILLIVIAIILDKLNYQINNLLKVILCGIIAALAAYVANNKWDSEHPTNTPGHEQI